MHEHLSKRGKVTATFMAILLTITLIAAFSPKATATPALTINIDPMSGTVGTEVQVNGTIDTLNGSYTIRWDGTLNVTTGYAMEYNVTTSFVVPQTVGASPPSGQAVLIELIDNNKTVDNVVNATFTLYTEYYVDAVVPSPPSQLREGQTTKIWVNVTGGEANTVYSANITVTDPSGAVYYNDTLQLTNTTSTGYGEGSITYPANFGLDANTDYVGLYLITFNGTLANGTFTVGLTDKTEYLRGQTVNIQASGYYASENVTVNITTAGVSVEGYPKNKTATANGVVTDSASIPGNAKAGIYTVTLTNTTATGTIKEPADAQNFTVVGATCQVQVWNVAVPPQPVANVIIWVRDATSEEILYGDYTNETGWAEFPVNLGNYTFEAVLVVGGYYVSIGSLNQSVTETITYRFNLTCWVIDMKIAIRDEAGHPLPFIGITLNYTYLTMDGARISTNSTFETDDTGMVTFSNALTNTSYTIEARRYGYLFNRTFIENPIVTPLINITCPTYTMFVHVLDSNGSPLQNAQVEVYEWSSGSVTGPETTNDLGSVSFSCTFGRYKVRVYNYSAQWKRTFILNETVIDLIEDQLSVAIHCKLSNLELSVAVTDYFRQPIPNARVKIEREFEGEYVNIANLTTKSNGKVFLPKIGGRYRISVYVMGKLFGINTFYLEESKVIVFRIDKLVVIGGYPLEITQFLAGVLLGIIALAFALALIYRRLRLRKALKGEEKEKSL